MAASSRSMRGVSRGTAARVVYGTAVSGPSVEQARRRQARQVAALVREVRLVGEAGAEGELAQAGAGLGRGEGDGPLEAQHPREAPRAVADLGHDAPPQVAGADPGLVRQRRHRRPRVAGHPMRDRRDQRVGPRGAPGAGAEPGEQARAAVGGTAVGRRGARRAGGRRRPTAPRPGRWPRAAPPRRTPNSGGAPPGRIRTPVTAAPGSRPARNAVRFGPTAWRPDRSSHSRSMQPSGRTRWTWPSGPARSSQAHATHGARAGGAGPSR